MPKIVVDASIWIPLYNEGRHSAALQARLQVAELLVSVVTLNEFMRGAHDAASKDIARSFHEIVAPTLITPSQAEWIECAQLSERILQHSTRSKSRVLCLQNDLLIAICARNTHATLITADRKDFSFLQEYCQCDVEFW